MAIGDFTNEYSRYKPNFVPVQSGRNDASQWGQRLQQEGAESAALPWVSAGLQGAGLISSLYGSYKQNEQADRNYEAQKAEFERQKILEAEQLKRDMAQRELQNSYSAADHITANRDRLMSDYAPYFRMTGR